MVSLLRCIARVREEEAGQTMVEYAVVLAVITGAIVATFALLSSASTDLINNVVSYL